MSFLEEYQKLIDKMPRASVEYSDTRDETGSSLMVWDSSYYSNSYYCTFLSKCTNNYYCHRNISCDNCFDCDDCGGLTNSYMCYYCNSSTELFNCAFCNGCERCDYSFLCFSCKDCFGCYGISDEQFCIFNKKVTEEEYKNTLPNLRIMSRSEILEQREKVLEKVAVAGKLELGGDSEDSVFTSEGWNNKSCFYCFGTYQSEDSYYCFDCESVKDSIDNTILVQSDRCFDCIYCFLCSECFYCFDCSNCSKSSYLHDCSNCIECFGCVGLRDKQHCILNKQYTPEEYAKKIVELKREAGWRV